MVPARDTVKQFQYNHVVQSGGVSGSTDAQRGDELPFAELIVNLRIGGVYARYSAYGAVNFNTEDLHRWS